GRIRCACTFIILVIPSSATKFTAAKGPAFFRGKCCMLGNWDSSIPEPPNGKRSKRRRRKIFGTPLTSCPLHPLLSGEHNQSGEHWRDDELAHPRFGVPRQSEKSLVPKQVIREKSNRENAPSVGAAPDGDRQNPDAIPRVQNGTKQEDGAECPK